MTTPISKHFHLENMNHEGFSPLMQAAKKGDILRAKFLIEFAQVNMDRVGQFGFTALHCAVVADEEEMVKYLLSKGASPNITCAIGYKPSDFASNKIKHLFSKPIISKL